MAGVAPPTESKDAAHVADLIAAHELAEGAPHGNDLRQGQENASIFRLDPIDCGGDLESINRPVTFLDETERRARNTSGTSGHDGA